MSMTHDSILALDQFVKRHDFTDLNDAMWIWKVIGKMAMACLPLDLRQPFLTCIERNVDWLWEYEQNPAGTVEKFLLTQGHDDGTITNDHWISKARLNKALREQFHGL